MCKCRSHGTFPLFGLQSSHLNICYYHQDLHRRPLRPGSRPGFYGDRRALLLIGAWPLPRRPGIGHALKRHPFSGLVDSADSLVRVSRRAGWGARRPTPGARWCRSTPRRRVLGSTIEVTTSPRAYQRPGLGPPPRSASVHAPSRSADRLSPFHIRPGRIAGPHPLPSRQFQALFDSLFKVLFIFPSRYLFAIGSGHDGALTLSGAPFQGTWARSVAEDASPDYNSDAEGDRFSSWAIPGSLAVTKGILAGFDNDPSAGSPTETLLRLLLPLNDKVQWTSRDVAGSEPPTSPRSEHFTGPFNRKATLPLTIPRRVFKSSAKDSTRRSVEITLQGGTHDLSDARATPTTRALGGQRPLLRVGNRATGACVASSPDSDLEAFSHNPAHGSFAPLAFQPSAMTNCANQRFLSY
ncbi:hypothetical protein V6N13_110328 [Hibiscus sabdariffa]